MELLAERLDGPRVVWFMLPAGEVTGNHADQVLEVLDPGDVIVEDSNGKWTDALDWPTAPASGALGTGHSVKTVHNGVEYGVMQAFAEGFAILNARRQWGKRDDEAVEHGLNLGAVAEISRTGSVVQSWLRDLEAEVLQARPGLGGIAPVVPDSGEGRWTVDEAVKLRVPAPVIAATLFQRFASQDEHGFADQMLSALRGQFGGHPVKGSSGTDGAFADEIGPDGTIEAVPGGVRTEGAST